MKTLKKAEQKNVEIKECYYSMQELNEMKEKPYIFTMADIIKQYDMNVRPLASDEILRIDLNYASELKVILTYGHYETVCIMQDGSQYYVTL